MAPSSLQHRRTHNLLLISKLLNQRDAASPFTLIVDNLEQSGKPLVSEYCKRANVRASKVQVIFISFETLKRLANVEHFIPAFSLDGSQWRKEILNRIKAEPTQRKLLIIDSLNALAATEGSGLSQTLSTFISPTTSVLAVYHMDVPTSASKCQANAYSPAPLTLLKYLATTIFTIHSLHHVLERKSARDRSHAQPVFGLETGTEGLVQGLGANGMEGLVLEMEHRRKSGRGVREWYFMPLEERPTPANTTVSVKAKEAITLLEDHPLYRQSAGGTAASEAESEAQAEATFELGLTDKQRRDREGVVLPYTDAQKGGGEGGRILYDMGSEDDFDEEEDEI